MTRTRDMYHEQSEEELLMSLMNEGWTREYAEKQIARRKEEAHNQIQDYFNSLSPQVAPN